MMETSSDDEGDSVSLLTKSTLIVFLLPLAFYKPKQPPKNSLSNHRFTACSEARSVYY